jgi:hypothetical protein
MAAVSAREHFTTNEISGEFIKNRRLEMKLKKMAQRVDNFNYDIFKG